MWENFRKSSLAVAFALMLLLVACDSRPDELIRYKKVIPDSLKTEASEKMIEILDAIKVTNRVDDEDMEYWIREAKETVIEIYGVETIGITDRNNWQFVPYDKCSHPQKIMIDEWLQEKRN